MNKYCISCSTIILEPTLLFCKSCDLEIAGLKIKSPIDNSSIEELPVLALFQYERRIRDLILQAKVDGKINTLQWMVNESLLNSGLHEFASWADVILPAPSSLWGRLRGKFDFPALLGHELNKFFDYHCLDAPLSLSWRTSKQSMFEKKERLSKGVQKALEFMEFFDKNSYNSFSKYLIIDDIITTGSTVKNLIEWLQKDNVHKSYNKNKEFKVFVFADAR